MGQQPQLLLRWVSALHAAVLRRGVDRIDSQVTVVLMSSQKSLPVCVVWRIYLESARKCG